MNNNNKKAVKHDRKTEKAKKIFIPYIIKTFRGKNKDI